MIHLSDVGTVFSVTCMDGPEVLDVSGASVLQIYFQKPSNGAIVGPKTLAFGTDGTNGVVTYTFEAGDLDTEGDWNYQVYVTLASGIKHSDWGKFTVYPNLV